MSFATDLRERGGMMSESIDEPRQEKKKKYTCPCGFSSYDLIEFLKHPFMEYTAELDGKEVKKPEGEAK